MYYSFSWKKRISRILQAEILSDYKIEITIDSPYPVVISFMDNYNIIHKNKTLFEILLQIQQKLLDEMERQLENNPECSYELIKESTIFTDLDLLRENVVKLTLWLYEGKELPDTIKFEFFIRGFIEKKFMELKEA